MVTSLLRVLVISFVCASSALASPARWKPDIDAFVASDATNPPPRDAIVFVGSSSIVKWKSLVSDFPDLKVIKRGFGGSELADSVAYADQIVTPYYPRAVVLYAGDNDIAVGKTPDAVLADFQAFRTKVHTAVPTAQIFYLSVKYSPIRARHQSAMKQLNELIAKDCAANEHCTFVDVNTPMLDAAGQPRPELFESDGLHMKPSSYALWVKVLAPLLQP